MSQLTIGPAAPTEQTEQTVTPAVASTAAFMRERRVRNWAYEVSLRPPLENPSGGNDLFLAPYETFPPEIPHAQYGQRDDNSLGTDDDVNRGRLPVDRDTARLRELHGDASELLDEVGNCGGDGPYLMGRMTLAFVRKYRRERWPAGKFMFLPEAYSTWHADQRPMSQRQQPRPRSPPQGPPPRPQALREEQVMEIVQVLLRHQQQGQNPLAQGEQAGQAPQPVTRDQLAPQFLRVVEALWFPPLPGQRIPRVLQHPEVLARLPHGLPLPLPPPLVQQPGQILQPPPQPQQPLLQGWQPGQILQPPPQGPPQGHHPQQQGLPPQGPPQGHHPQQQGPPLPLQGQYAFPQGPPPQGPPQGHHPQQRGPPPQGPPQGHHPQQQGPPPQGPLQGHHPQQHGPPQGPPQSHHPQQQGPPLPLQGQYPFLQGQQPREQPPPQAEYSQFPGQFQNLPLPQRQAPDPEDVLYSIFNSGDASNVHRVFTEFIERKLNPRAGSIARHFRFQPGDARNLAITHLGIADEPQTSDEAYQEPEGWCYNPREGTGFIESTRNVTAVIPLMALDRNEEFVVVSDCGDGAKEPDVLILDEHRPWVILMAIEIVYKNESIVGILYSLSIWTQQTTQRRAHVPPSAEPGGARPPCHALALHVADAHEFRQDPRYPAFAWAEAYRYEPGKEPVAGGFHGNLVVMNASSAYCQLWKDALASELCPIRLLFVGNSHVFHLPIPVRAPRIDGEEVTYTQPQWDLASLTLMYHEGMLLDSFENDGGLNPTPRRGEARLEA